LPGEDRITCRVDADADPRMRHVPSGFDMALAFVLQQQAEQQGAARGVRNNRTVRFHSCSQILRLLGVGNPDSDYRQRLRSSLQYWQVVTLRYRQCWHVMGDKQNVDMTLPPLIQQIEEWDGIVITLADQWPQPQHRYYARLPMPVPVPASAQNLVLLHS